MATKAEMELELAQLRAKVEQQNSTEALGGDIDGENDGLFLNIRDELFECRRIDVSYQMMKFAVAQRKANVNIPKNMPQGAARKALEEKRNQAGMSLMDTMLTTVLALLKPHERDRFDEFMNDLALSDNPLDPGEFQQQIGEVIAAAGGQKGKGRKAPITSSPSSSSSQTTSESLPDDWSSRAPADLDLKAPANQ